MDSDIVVPENGHGEEVHQNGGHNGLLLSGEEEDILNNTDKVSDIAVLNGSLGTVNLEDHGIDSKSSHDGSTIPQEEKESKRVNSKTSQKLKSEGKKNEKPLHAKVTATNVSKKGKDGKDLEAVASSHDPKQPTRSKSFNDRQPQSNASTKQAGKSNAASNEVSGEQMKLKPLNKGAPSKGEGDAQHTKSPTSEDGKPRRAGALPNYGFSFKCDERAEKRREYYTKLEEKIHAKEVEKNTMQAKSKESQEAEIKLLRKSLTFKATPLPNFYQEPAPSKPELKKIPTTRAKSPKLGRKKGSAGEESEESSGRQRSGRMSLDNVNRNNPAKVQSAANPKKPIRKSLPKLPSEKTSLPGAVAKPTNPSQTAGKQETSSNGAGAEENCALSVVTTAPTSQNQGQEQAREAEPGEVQPDANDVQETIAVEH